VPVTVYVVVTVGLAVGLAHVLHDRPVDGNHEYDVPPVAVSTVDVPEHMEIDGLTPIVGSGFTVTVTIALFWQPAALKPVTV
jgi:hypothetical protein